MLRKDRKAEKKPKAIQCRCGIKLIFFPQHTRQNMVYPNPIHKHTHTLKPHILFVAVVFYNFRLYWQKFSSGYSARTS